jgi:molybdopterin converting factor small subunit
MNVRVLLFATYADIVGQGTVDLAVPPPATVADVLRELRANIPAAQRLPSRPLVAVNRVHAAGDTPVSDGDELAVLPPMAGG